MISPLARAAQHHMIMEAIHMGTKLTVKIEVDASYPLLASDVKRAIENLYYSPFSNAKNIVVKVTEITDMSFEDVCINGKEHDFHTVSNGEYVKEVCKKCGRNKGH